MTKKQMELLRFLYSTKWRRLNEVKAKFHHKTIGTLLSRGYVAIDERQGIIWLRQYTETLLDKDTKKLNESLSKAEFELLRHLDGKRHARFTTLLKKGVDEKTIHGLHERRFIKRVWGCDGIDKISMTDTGWEAYHRSKRHEKTKSKPKTDCKNH